MLKLTTVERTFTFDVDGEECSIPAAATAPASLFERMADANDKDEQTRLIVNYISTLIPENVNAKMNIELLVTLATSWWNDMRGDGVGKRTAGESSPSSD